MTDHPNGWQADLNAAGVPHVWPVNDLRPHEIDRACWCDPEGERGDGIVVHASADGREKFERGERRAS